MEYKFETKAISTISIEKSSAKETRVYNAYRANISINEKKIESVQAAYFTTKEELQFLIDYVQTNS